MHKSIQKLYSFKILILLIRLTTYIIWYSTLCRLELGVYGLTNTITSFP